MTETTFPFGDVDAMDPFVDEAESTGRDRRVLLMAGGVAAALALAAGSFFLLGGGDDAEAEAFTPAAARPRVAQQAAPTTRKVATKPPAAAALPVPFEDDLGRNPFKPLYVVPAAPAAAAATDPTLPTGGTTGTTTGSTTGGTGTTAGGTTTGTTTGSTGSGTGTGAAGPTAPEAPTAQEYALVLKRVYGAGKDLTAEFTIDGRRVVAKVGVRFGPTSEIRLISLQQGPKAGQWTSVLQVGDGEPFDAVTGEKVSVR